MQRRNILGLSAIAAVGLALLPGSAFAQQKSLKDQIVGTWSLVSWEQTLKDGSKNLRFGNDPKGVNTFTPDGHFTLIITRSDLPKISSGNPEKPTPEEAQALVSGSIAYFGTYTVDEATKTVSQHLDATTLVNQLAMPQARVVTSISADAMTYSNSNSVAGGNIVLVWKRVAASVIN
jgi:hypothetical protein